MRFTLQAAPLIWLLFCGGLRADDWPQWRGPGRDGVWRESGLIEKFDGPQIKLRWRAAISSGYSGPTVADDRVFVMDRVTEPSEMERVHCFDWSTGQALWTHSYACDYRPITFQAGPRASVTIEGNRVYALGAVGHFHCLDAANGKVLWKKDLVSEYHIKLLPWGIAPAPLVDGELVILQVGAPKAACVIAFDKRTGREIWTALDEPTSYASPIVIEQAGRRLLVCWTGASISALDPKSGALYWQHASAHQGGWIDPIVTPVWDSNRLFVSCTLDGSLMLKLHPDQLKVDALWQHKGGGARRGPNFHAVLATPCLAGNAMYGFDGYGQLRCVDANTGTLIWEDLTVASQVIWGMAYMIRNGDKTWLFNDRGELIISRLSPQGFTLLSRAELIKPTRAQLPRRGGVCWSHPAYANQHVFARNDEELVCASLAADVKLAGRRVAPTAPGKGTKETKSPPPPLVAPFDAQAIKRSQQAWARHLGLPVEHTNMIGMVCVLIPPGEFDMGSTQADQDRLIQEARERKLPQWYLDCIPDEHPQHRVKITRPFYISKYEVTVAQFGYSVKWGDNRPGSDKQTGSARGLNLKTGEIESGPQYTWEKPGFEQGGRHPVVNVTWDEAVAFCAYLQSVEGDTCRLPTEAEWEYACRCGTVSKWASGNDERGLQRVANVADASLHAKWPKVAASEAATWDDGHPFTAPVGSFEPNAFGLHDMHGNVWEWCQDWFAPNDKEGFPRVDPQGSAAGTLRICRGGSWRQAAPVCRSAFRLAKPPSERDIELGFRVVQAW